ncbi:O-methyltransferase [Actinomycetospora sp. TBRC 11914]|uniref:O-methyltransferase n=1 Tax=Actinomycetospora sp. TBRC 11914 TaxID=2729387 RepID=UPI00145CBF24|nr:O-methyltransferase [Actinomycetospora sp. TBRC 11914]NMO93744.1 O-methyltransferase [Actinomycetospora sp. TBRC 11914]
MADASEVDAYFETTLGIGDPLLDRARERARAGGLPDIAVSPLQGAFLALLVRLTGARRVLEVGTLGGYSGTVMARALPDDGALVTLEVDPHHAEVARAVFDEAGVAGKVDVVVGRAADTLPGLEGPFDLVFIDADKPSNPAYVRAAVDLSRAGTVIVVDNVVRGGAVADPGDTSPAVTGSREVTELIAAEPRLEATALQTVGAKGWDGFLLARVVG